MVSVASQLIEEVTAHAQSDSLKDAREICADGTYFPNNLCKCFGENCRESQRTHFMFSNFFSKNYAICEIMWNNVVDVGRPQMMV